MLGAAGTAAPQAQVTVWRNGLCLWQIRLPARRPSYKGRRPTGRAGVCRLDLLSAQGPAPAAPPRPPRPTLQAACYLPETPPGGAAASRQAPRLCLDKE